MEWKSLEMLQHCHLRHPSKITRRRSLTVKDKLINREGISYVFTVLLSHVKQALSVKNQIFLTLKYKVTSMLNEKNIALQQWNSSLYSSQGLKS